MGNGIVQGSSFMQTIVCTHEKIYKEQSRTESQTNTDGTTDG